jgi:hypothetical protein
MVVENSHFEFSQQFELPRSSPIYKLINWMVVEQLSKQIAESNQANESIREDRAVRLLPIS